MPELRYGSSPHALQQVYFGFSTVDTNSAQALLPFFVVVFDILRPSPRSLPAPQSTPAKSSILRLSLPSRVLYAGAALAWAYFVIAARMHSPQTSAICFGATWGNISIPQSQLLMCIIDAILVVAVASIHLAGADKGFSGRKFTVLLFLVTGVYLMVRRYCFPPGPPQDLSRSWLQYGIYSSRVGLGDLTKDTIASSLALFCGISLLESLHPSAVALVATSLALLGSQILPLASSQASAVPLYAAAAVVSAICYFTLYRADSARLASTANLHRTLWVGHVGLVIFGLVSWLLLASKPASLAPYSAMDKMIADARQTAQEWKAQAGASKSLAEAVSEYRRRHGGMAPPPNFDKWYQFAVDKNATIIDDFGQIDQDMLPYWGLPPALIRSRIDYLYSYANVELGGLKIRDGKLLQSPHIPGTHRWMTDSIALMVEPFVKWLPDMDIPINLADECRITIPYDDMQRLKANASESFARAAAAKSLQSVGSNSASMQAPRTANFSDPADHDINPDLFNQNNHWQLYYDFIAETCPPDSKARNTRWVDRSVPCTHCAAPHSVATSRGMLLSNASLAFDLCHQPDMAYLDGFIMSPALIKGSHALFPIFSQGRVGGFSDILFPSPWNFVDKTVYDEETDMPWGDKKNDMFWRGSSTDGYTLDGAWRTFVRARFVHEAYQKALALAPTRKTPSTRPLFTVNASFVGDMHRCDHPDCDDERAQFEIWGKATFDSQDEQRTGLPPPMNFEEHWSYRHLIDMDGAGFSGRFLPFLQSQSLVYRAAVFKTWFDERITAWHHFVPVDARLGDSLWTAFEYLAGGDERRTKEGVNSGAESARRIAEQGREWASQALRKEDMQIYMFRLLLEWGRVTDDDREVMGFQV